MRIINVREQTRNAIGDGITDDTQAFNEEPTIKRKNNRETINWMG